MGESTLDEIRQLDAGTWFDPKFAGEKVPIVEDIFELVAEYAQHDVLITVDLKAETVEQRVGALAAKHSVLPRLLTSPIVFVQARSARKSGAAVPGIAAETESIQTGSNIAF